MRLLSYLIIMLISVAVGNSFFKTVNLINQKEVVFFYPVPNMEDRYLLEPVVNLIAADLAAQE
jgi:hypothetical protein